MLEIATNVGYSIIASIIYDVSKICVGRFINIKDDTKLDEIKKKIELKNGQYTELLQSGEFCDFIQTPSFKDLICNYIIYKITGLYNGSIRKVKKNSQIINEKQIIEYLVEQLFSKYYVETIAVPSKTVVRNFFCDLFDISAEIVVEHMSKQGKAETFFVNRRVDLMQEILVAKVDTLTDIIKRTMQCEIVPIEKRYEENIQEYHKIMKTNNSKAHVYLLDTFDFSEFYVPPFLENRNQMEELNHLLYMEKREMMRRKNKKKELFDDWRYIFENNNIVYITGGAGYGKSLFLKKIINDFSNLNIMNSTEYIIIYGELKGFFKEDGQPLSVIKFLQQSMAKETLMDIEKFPIQMIEYYLKMGRCIILLDALDEVEKEKRVDLHKKVISYFQNQNPNNKICITSRNRGFIPERQVEVFDIEPLSRMQIEEYVDNIIKLKKFDQSDKQIFLKQSNILVKKGFLNSFLVLSLLINIYKAERELPENKMELYQKCFEYIANRREREKTQGKFDWKDISCMMKDNTFMELANMCFPNNSDIGKNEIIEMLCKVYRGKYPSEMEAENAAEQFLYFCSDRTELFVPAAGEDRFKFFHRSFFEYFYSQYIFLRIRDVKDVYNTLEKFDVDSEVFELTFAMMKQKDEYRYQELVEYIFDKMKEEIQGRTKTYTAMNIMILGMQVVDDALYKDKFISFLIENAYKIAKESQLIHNQWILKNIIFQNMDYIIKINNAYVDYAKYNILEAFCEAIPRIMEILSEMKEVKISEEEEKQFYKRKFFFYKYEYVFYTDIYIKKNGIDEICQNINLDELENVSNKCKITKKRREKNRKLIEKYEQLDPKSKMKILEIWGNSLR